MSNISALSFRGRFESSTQGNVCGTGDKYKMSNLHHSPSGNHLYCTFRVIFVLSNLYKCDTEWRMDSWTSLNLTATRFHHAPTNHWAHSPSFVSLVTRNMHTSQSNSIWQRIWNSIPFERIRNLFHKSFSLGLLHTWLFSRWFYYCGFREWSSRKCPLEYKLWLLSVTKTSPKPRI